MEQLLRAGADKESGSPDRRTPLYITCENNQEGAADVLLRAGANREAVQVDGFTPLMIAASGGYSGVVALLLKARANEDAVTRSGRTPLMLACAGGHKEAAELLLRHGADVSRVSTTRTCNDRETAMSLAIGGDHVEIVELLLRSGADKDAKHAGEGYEQVTDLYVACKSGNTRIATAFIRAGADTKAGGPGWHSPLHAACEGGYATIVAALVAAGVDTGTLTENHCTALFLAVKMGHTDTVKAMLKVDRGEPRRRRGRHLPRPRRRKVRGGAGGIRGGCPAAQGTPQVLAGRDVHAQHDQGGEPDERAQGISARNQVYRQVRTSKVDGRLRGQ